MHTMCLLMDRRNDVVHAICKSIVCSMDRPAHRDSFADRYPACRSKVYMLDTPDKQLVVHSSLNNAYMVCLDAVVCRLNRNASVDRHSLHYYVHSYYVRLQ